MVAQGAKGAKGAKGHLQGHEIDGSERAYQAPLYPDFASF